MRETAVALEDSQWGWNKPVTNIELVCEHLFSQLRIKNAMMKNFK